MEEEILKALEDLRTELNQRFDQLDKKLDSLEAKIKAIAELKELE